MIASTIGNKEICEILIKNGANVNLNDHDGKTPIIMAAATGNFEIFRLLVNNGAKIDIKDYFGWDIYDWAEIGKNKEIRSFLNKQKVFKKSNQQLDYDQIINKLIKGDLDLNKLLANKIDLNIKDSFGTPLLIKVILSKQKKGLAKELIKNGIGINMRDVYGDTPLAISARLNHLDLCIELIRRGADINAINYSGDSILMEALNIFKKNDDEISYKLIEFLINNGVNIVEKGPCGKTILFHSIIYNKLKIADIFMKYSRNVWNMDYEYKSILKFKKYISKDAKEYLKSKIKDKDKGWKFCWSCL